jgi:hypothetical protein
METLTERTRMSEEISREQIALAMFSATLNAALERSQNMLTANGARKVMENEMRSAWELADIWISQRPKIVMA